MTAAGTNASATGRLLRQRLGGGGPGGSRRLRSSTYDVHASNSGSLGVASRSPCEAADAVGSGRIDPAPLYTHRFGLDEVGEAIAATRDKPEGFVKALVMFA